MADGKFIVFEGIDGSGTTTQTERAAAWLRAKGLDVVETFEPTDGPVGALIRKALRHEWPGPEGREPEPELFALLFATDRLDHLRGRVVPTLERGRWVASDRCVLSSLAYQSLGCDLAWVRELNRHVRRPDLTVLLDLDAETAYGRLAGRHPEREVFEQVETLAAIRRNYLEIAEVLRGEGERIVTVDASPPVDEVANVVEAALSELL
jgi:dTMP kinase